MIYNIICVVLYIINTLCTYSMCLVIHLSLLNSVSISVELYLLLFSSTFAAKGFNIQIFETVLIFLDKLTPIIFDFD